MIVEQRRAEITLEKATNMADILREDRPIETELFPQFNDRGGIRRDTALGEQEFGGIARDEMNDKEDERDDRPDQPERDCDPRQRIAEHRFTRPLCLRTSSPHRR